MQKAVVFRFANRTRAGWVSQGGGIAPKLDKAHAGRISSRPPRNMSTPDTLPSTPSGSLLEAIIAATGGIYARIDRDQRAFLSGAAALGSALECPPGCGSCCEPFVPDILPSEAAIIAAWLLESAPELAQETAAWKY